MFDLLNSEIFRLRKRPQSWMLVAIAAALSALIYFGFAIAARFSDDSGSSSMRSDATFDGFESFAVPMGLGFFTGIMLIIVAANLMGNEFSWNTLRPLVARASSRGSILTSKLLTLLIYSLVFTVILFAVMVVYVFIGSAIVGEAANFSFGTLGDGLVVALEMLYTNLPYMALAFMLATVAKSNAAGIAGALGVTFIEQPIWLLLGLASDVFEDLQEYGISYNVNQILGDGIKDSPQPTLIVGVYTVIFVAISYIVFLRRDVTSG